MTKLLLFLLGCAQSPEDTPSAEPDPSPFETCNPQEIESLASKHGYMLVFGPCGSNLFQEFAWSTDGQLLYYQMGMTHHVLDVGRKSTAPKLVPTSMPVGSALWVTPKRLVLPLGPAADGGEDAPFRLGIYDVDTGAVFNVELPGWTDPTDLQRGASPDHVLLTAKKDGVRRVIEIQLSTTEIKEPFPWIKEVDTFSYTAEGNGVVLGVGNTVTLYDATGKAKGQWSPATRGALHKEGRWLALEHLGEPVSVFHPVGIEELPQAERDARLAQAEEKARQLPPDAPRTVRPPTLSFVDTETAKRWLVTGIQGSQFEWYNSQKEPYYASFVSWGFERKQFRRNILLGNNEGWLLGIAQDRDMLGIAPAVASTEAASSGSASPEPEPAAPAQR